MKGKSNIVFYSRKERGVTGDYSLYYRMAVYLSEKLGREVICLNNTVPDMMDKYKNTKIKFLEITSSNKSFFENSIFIAPFNQMYNLLEETHGIRDCRYYFLFLHPEIIYWFRSQMFVCNMNSIFKLLSKTKSYGAQDGANLIEMKKNCSISLLPSYFPVVIETELAENVCEYHHLVEDSRLNLAWFGRLDIDKVYSVVNILDNLYEALDNRKAIMHIIGDGKALSKINVNKYAPKITIVFNSYLFNEEKDNYLRTKVDAVFAMGVSSLDAAILGVPTIIPPVWPRNFRTDKYVYIFDTKDYNIGWMPGQMADIDCKKYTMEEIVDQLMTSGTKQEYGRMSREFVINTFSVESNMEQILKRLDESSLTKKKLLSNPTILLQEIINRMYHFITGKDFEHYYEFKESFSRVSNKGRLKILYNWMKESLR